MPGPASCPLLITLSFVNTDYHGGTCFIAYGGTWSSSSGDNTLTVRAWTVESGLQSAASVYAEAPTGSYDTDGLPAKEVHLHAPSTSFDILSLAATYQAPNDDSDKNTPTAILSTIDVDTSAGTYPGLWAREDDKLTECYASQPMYAAAAASTSKSRELLVAADDRTRSTTRTELSNMALDASGKSSLTHRDPQFDAAAAASFAISPKFCFKIYVDPSEGN